MEAGIKTITVEEQATRQTTTAKTNDDLQNFLIGRGSTGMVHLSPCGTRVVKSAWRRPGADACENDLTMQQLRREIQIYRHLGDQSQEKHPRLIQMLDAVDDGQDHVAITLEYLPHGSLHELLTGVSHRRLLQRDPTYRYAPHPVSVPRKQRARWALEATAGIAFLHAHDVLHCDIRPENMLLDDQNSVRIVDLSGSTLPGQKALSLENASFFLPRSSPDGGDDIPCSVTSDLFALGSSIYEIVTSSPPYAGMRYDEIEARFSRQEFPSLVGEGEAGKKENFLFANIIRKCWFCEFESTADVLAALQAETSASFSDVDLAYIEEASGILVD